MIPFDTIWLTLTDATDGTRLYLRADQLLVIGVDPSPQPHPTGFPGRAAVAPSRPDVTVIMTSTDRALRVRETPERIFEFIAAATQTTKKEAPAQ